VGGALLSPGPSWHNCPGCGGCRGGGQAVVDRVDELRHLGLGGDGCFAVLGVGLEELVDREALEHAFEDAAVVGVREAFHVARHPTVQCGPARPGSRERRVEALCNAVVLAAEGAVRLEVTLMKQQLQVGRHGDRPCALNFVGSPYPDEPQMRSRRGAHGQDEPAAASP
jgi:hypothetical protein